MPKSKHLFVGLDCGGTNSRAKLADFGGDILGEGTAGPANGLLGLSVVLAEIEKAVRHALAAAGMETFPVDKIHAGLGLAGLNLTTVREQLNHFSHPFASLTAETDACIAQLGAFDGADGAILIAGTGSCGYSVLAGKVTVIGGNGFKLSDQGSGARLGYAAARRAMLGHDGSLPNTDLCREIMSRFDYSVDKIVGWAETAKPKDFGSLTPIVFDYAEKDDAAVTLIKAAAQDVDRMIAALIGCGHKSVVLIGGMSGPLSSWLSDASKAALIAPLGDALDGALMLAMRGNEGLQGPVADGRKNHV